MKLKYMSGREKAAMGSCTFTGRNLLPGVARTAVTEDAAAILQKDSLSKIEGFIALAKELKSAGAERAALISAINEVYDGNGEDVK